MTNALIKEEFCRLASGFDMSVNMCTTNFCFLISKYGTETQKKRYIPPVIRGDDLAAFCLTEPGAGSNALSLKTSYRRDGDAYILNGSKTFITNAPIARLFMMVAREQGTTGAKGGTLFILERGMGRIATGKPLEKMGMRCSPTGETFLENVAGGQDQILGEEGRGFQIMFEILDEERALGAVNSIGIAQVCLDASVKYAKERGQFGRALSSFQMIQNMLAEMATQLCISRQFAYMLCPLIDRGIQVTMEAAMAKYHASVMAARIALDAIQIMGGYGYMRDAKLVEIGGGTSEIQKRIIARELLKQ